MKVAKFGGSSLASAEQVKKVCSIITDDPERKLVVVSAPGKRDKDDTKVTDMLISLAETCIKGADYGSYLNAVSARFAEIISDLGVDSALADEIKKDIKSRIDNRSKSNSKFLDTMKAAGEDNNAKVVAAYLQKQGHKAAYVNPKEAGLLLSEDYGNALVIEESYENLAKLNERDEICVFPGFFGYSKSGDVVTFSRGGSDVTGAILAKAVNASVYENFTDVDSVFVASPAIIENPAPMTVITYREMRELSYAGFSVFHEEALMPVYRAGIPVNIKNTNNPSAPGTTIVSKRESGGNPVVGIAGSDGFCCIYVRKYLMNREIGFGRKLLQILEEEGIPFEHIPSGIDDISVLIHEKYFEKTVEDRVLKRIESTLKVDNIYVERDLSLVMVVGEGMNHTLGLAARVTGAFAKDNVNLEMINQGASEVSLMFGVKTSDEDKAIKALYKEFFV